MSLPRLAEVLKTTVDTLLTGQPGETAAAAAPAKPPEELIVRMRFSDSDGLRLGVNLPFNVFRMLVRHDMISVTVSAEEDEAEANELVRRLRELDFAAIVRMIEGGVSGRLMDVDTDGERLTIWTE